MRAVAFASTLSPKPDAAAGPRDLAALRETISRLERGSGSSGLARKAIGADRVTLGGPQNPCRLDVALGGGAARAALHEVVPMQAADSPAAGAFALALAARFAATMPGIILWVVEEFATREWGAPYGPGLALQGIDPARLVLVRAADAKDALWALEEALKCRSAAVVIGELWGSARLYDLAATRRLAEAARQGGAPGILVHPSLPAERTALTSGARGRFGVAARRSLYPADQVGPTPMPGAQAWGVRLLKVQAEGGRAVAFDPDRIHDVIWNHQEGVFRDAVSLHLAAGSAHQTGPNLRARSA